MKTEQFHLRLPKELKEQMEIEAKKLNLSINSYIVMVLSKIIDNHV